MAKTPWFGYAARGKVGNVVLQKGVSGQTVMRERVTEVKNPRTSAQQVQRMLNTSVMAAYSTLKSICDHSFEGVSYGAKSMQYFLKANYPLAKSKYQSIIDGGNNVAAYFWSGLNLRQNKTIAGAGYLVSKGSISLNASPLIWDGKLPGFVLNSVTAETTAQAWLNAMNMLPGDQLTILAVVANTDASAYEVTYGGRLVTQNVMELKLGRYVFSSDSTKLAKTLLDSTGAINSEILDTSASEKNDKIAFSTNQQKALLTYNDDQVIYAAAAIVSRKDGDKWLRSTQYLLGDEETSQGLLLKDLPVVLSSYNPSSREYLNNAETVYTVNF